MATGFPRVGWSATRSPSPSPPRRIVLVYTGGVAGELRSCGCSEGDLGGLAVRAAATAAIRDASRGPVFVLDTGDTHLRTATGLTRGELARARSRADLFARFHARIGLDALVPGELDLALGADRLAALYPDPAPGAPPGPRVLAANLRDGAGRKLFPATAIVAREGFRLGLVGAVAEFLVLGPEGARLQVTPPVPAIEAAVAELRRQGVHLVVLLSHLGLDEETRVAARVRGLDLVLGGHSRDRTPEPVFQGRVAIVQAGTRGKFLGRVEVELGEPGPDSVPDLRVRHQLVPMVPGLARDPEVEAWVEAADPKRTGPRTHSEAEDLPDALTPRRAAP